MESSQLQAMIEWLGDSPMMVGREYRALVNGQQVNCSVTELKYLVGKNSTNHLAAKFLEKGQKGLINIQLEVDLLAAPEVLRNYSIVLVDKSNQPLSKALGIQFVLRRSANITWQSLSIDRQAREQLMNQKGCCIWFTGLSGSGKSTIASAFEKLMYQQGFFTMTLDGDNVRHGLNKDLGFSEADRVENIRRAAEVARLMVDAGLIVLVSFISPFRAERQLARSLFNLDRFFEVFVDTPLSICEARDVKGLYEKARRGEIKNFTGIDSPYEPPKKPDIHLKTDQQSVQLCCQTLQNFLLEFMRD